MDLFSWLLLAACPVLIGAIGWELAQLIRLSKRR